MPAKIKWHYSKRYVTKVINSIPPSQLKLYKECIKIGYTAHKLEREFRLPEVWAAILYEKYKPISKEKLAVIGSKTEPYYEKEEDMTIPEYKVEDLTGEEKYLAKKRLPNSWKWEE